MSENEGGGKMKYKVGDKVKVIKVSEGFDPSGYTEDQINSITGATGEIIKIDSKYEYPYSVEFDNAEYDELDLNLWKEDELDFSENFKREHFDVNVDDDKVNIIDWIQSHFHKGNWHKNFEVTVELREKDYVEENDDLKRIYVD